MTSAIVLAAGTKGDPKLLVAVVLAILAVMLVTLIFLLLAQEVHALIGLTARKVIVRVFGCCSRPSPCSRSSTASPLAIFSAAGITVIPRKPVSSFWLTFAENPACAGMTGSLQRKRGKPLGGYGMFASMGVWLGCEFAHHHVNTGVTQSNTVTRIMPSNTAAPRCASRSAPPCSTA